MVLDAVIKKIDRHIKKDYVQPMIVDVQNAGDLQAIHQHYNVGSTVFLSAREYCGKDSDPQLDRLYDDLTQKDGVIFITGLSVFLKLQGEQRLKDSIKTILSLTTKGQIVVLTYQCKKFLSFADPRLQNRIIIVDGEEGSHPSLIFTLEGYKAKGGTASLHGVDSLPSIEEISADTVTVYTKNCKASYPLSLIYISERNKAYDVLCDIDSNTAHLDAALGNDEQWLFALEQFDGKDSWAELICVKFGNCDALQLILPNYPSFSKSEKWLYFIALKLYGCPGNWCLNTAAKAAITSTELVKQIYRSALLLDPTGEDFADCYLQRKQLLTQLGNPIDEVVDFCKVLLSKGENAIYCLTDNTQKERELIFSLLDTYGEQYGKQHVMEIMRLVYPDLAAYLAPYNFHQDLLNYYFDQYKYQKVINRVLPEFDAIVMEQAQNPEYTLLLPPRASLVEGIKTDGAQLYFVDAMGVEYLSFILAQCKELHLLLKVSICCCELPSITSRNKEFLEYFQNGAHPIASIKDIDEIKHHGKDSYDYQQTKLPIHLAKELEIIKELLKRIKEKLASETIKKAVLIADHGASRLAVIHETETIWEMPEKGVHSGRCCLKSDIDQKPPYAMDADDFWSLANYDRFKGGRKANVEVHGGATLEEVAVPIIELTYNPGKIEVHILPVSNTSADFNAAPEIEVSFRKKAAVRIYISATVSDVSIRIDEKSYDAKESEPNYFYVEMPDIKRPRTYYADVFAGDNLIAEHLPIKVKGEGMSSNSKGIL